MSGQEGFHQYAGYQHVHNEPSFQSVSSLRNPQNPYQTGQNVYGSINPHMESINQPSTPPRTPRKTAGRQYQQNMPYASGQESGIQSKSNRKTRSKKATASPAVSRIDGNTVFRSDSVPLPAVPSSAKRTSTPAAAAYAGPTFHASPAPSTLPIPSFLSKSIPESPTLKGAIPDMAEPSSSGEDYPTILAAQISKVPSAREESPLDMFFKADRAEKARAHSASILGTSAADVGPFQPPHASPERSRPVSGIPARSTIRPASDSTSFSMPSGSTDGTKPYGPAFSTPYVERINAARSIASPASHSTTQIPTDRSDALKAFLFSGRPSSSVTSKLGGFADLSKSPATRDDSFSRNPTPTGTQQSSARYNDQGGNGRTSRLHKEVDITPKQTPLKSTGNDLPHPTSIVSSYTTVTPVVTRDFSSRDARENSAPPIPISPALRMGSQNSDLLEMEESLRRMLKLTPSQSRTPA